MTEHNDLLYIDQMYIKGFLELLNRFNYDSEKYTVEKTVIGNYEYQAVLDNFDFDGQINLQVRDLNKPLGRGNILEQMYENIYEIDINLYNVLDKIKYFERKLKLKQF